MEVLVVSNDRAGLELDEFLCLERPLFNKGFFRRLVRAGEILVDGQPVLPNIRLREGSVVMTPLDELAANDELPRTLAAPAEALAVIHESAHLLVVDKPAGVASEPERWEPEAACMAGALLAHSLEAAGDGPATYRPRLLHRLDKDTTGVLVAAKDLDTERILRGAFESGHVHKTYLALVEGEWDTDGDTLIDAPLGEEAALSKRERKRLGGARRGHRMAAFPDGHKEAKPARTVVRAKERFRGFTLVECEPHTGRTHQIRVHLAHLGFPLAVDPLYGRRDEFLLSEIKRNYRPKPGRPERPLLDRLSLHAAAIELPDPSAPDFVPGADPAALPRVRYHAPMPEDFQRITRQLAKWRPHKQR